MSAAVRKDTGLVAGDPIRVTLTINETVRDVLIREDFDAALQANPGTEEFFGALSNSLQRYHIDEITSAKTDETRRRRIDKSIGPFRDGKKR